VSDDREELRRRVDRGAALWHRWRETGDIDVLRECLEASRHALELNPSNPFARQNVVRVLVQLYRGTGDVAVLDEALEHVAGLIPEHEEEDGDPRLVVLAREVIALAEGRPRHAEARLKFLTTCAELSCRVGELCVSMAVEDRDLDALGEGIALLDEALSAPTDDPAVRSARMHARAWAALVRWQMLREPADLDFAVEGLQVAQFLAGQDVPAELFGDLARSLLFRYQDGGDFADLSAAVDLLAGSGDADHRGLLQEIYFERYEATADIADLDAAIGLARRLVDAAPADEELRATLRNLLAVRLVYREDAGIAAEVARLSTEVDSDVPHELTTILDWTRTWEDGTAPDPAPSGPARRVLFLRTFKDPAADVVVLRHLAAASGRQDVIVLLSDARDEAQLAAAAGDHVELVTTTDHDWTRVVHREMAAADAVVLHLSPKDLALPRVSRPLDLSAEFPWELWKIDPDAGPEHRAAAETAIAEFTSKRNAAFDATPLGGIPTGAGLLRELAYLDRLDCLERTVVVLDNLHLFSFSQRVVNAAFSTGDVTRVDGSRASARLTALERQLGLLHQHRNGITFSAREDGGCSPAFTGALGTALAGLPARRGTTGDLPLGTSPHPRRLPPDDRLKVISHTPVEDLVVIPPFEFVEIPPAAIREYFHYDVIARGCPRCGGPFDQIFFYTDGLVPFDIERLPDHGNGKCQRCSRKSTVWGPEALADF
jgi:tetratricopeptide (TPR) repeat protein